MKIESRYVEYSGSKRVVEGVWSSHMAEAPAGCMDVGISKEIVLKRLRMFKAQERRDGCSNFEYRVI